MIFSPLHHSQCYQLRIVKIPQFKSAVVPHLALIWQHFVLKSVSWNNSGYWLVYIPQRYSSIALLFDNTLYYITYCGTILFVISESDHDRIYNNKHKITFSKKKQFYREDDIIESA